MRDTRIMIAKSPALLVLLLASCGSNAPELQRARGAHYHGDPGAMIELAASAVQGEHYVIQQLDKDLAAFTTAPKVWGPEGDLESAGADGVVQFEDNSIELELKVQLRPAEGADDFDLVITPSIHRLMSGTAVPQAVEPGDVSLPGWVQAKLDAIAIVTHDALATYEIKTPAP